MNSPNSEPFSAEILVSDHARRCLTFDNNGRDQIDRRVADEDFDDLIETPWPEINPPSRRKDSELARMLDLLDNLPTGKDTE